MLTLVTKALVQQRQQAADVAALEAMQAARPLRPPGPLALGEPTTSAAARDAAMAREREPRMQLESDETAWNEEEHRC